MKFSACALALAAAVSATVVSTTTVDASSIRGNTKASKKLMQKATRILEQNNNANNGNYNWQNGYYQQQQQGGGGGEDAEYSYLMGYSIKLLTCLNGQQTVNYETREVDMSTVVFRLCPVDSCDDDLTQGCDEGYGDYTVGLSTFLEAYMEGQQEQQQQQQQNNNGNGNGQQYNYNYQDGGAYQGNSMSMVYYSSYGQEFDVSEYARECREFNVEEFNNNDGNNNNGNNGNGQYYYNGQYGNNGNNGNGGNAYNGYVYYDGDGNAQQAAYNLYMGPTCTSDGTGIRLAIFSDAYCSYENTDVSFNTLTNGMFSNIPYFVTSETSSSTSDGDDGDDSSSTTTTEFVSLVPDTCMKCTDMNDNNEYELSEVCTRTYQQSSARCEANMEWKSYYGGYNDDKTCALINDLLSGTGIVSYSKSSDGDDEETDSSSRKGLTWDLNDEYLWDVIVLILGVSAGILLVLYCVKDETVQKLKEAKENPSDTMASIKESTKSAAAGTKLLVTTAVATTVATVRRTFAAEETTVEKKISEDETDYKNMEEPAPTGEESKSVIISQEDTPKTHAVVEEPKKKANSSRRLFGLMRGKSTK